MVLDNMVHLPFESLKILADPEAEQGPEVEGAGGPWWLGGMEGRTASYSLEVSLIHF